jgi:hypothetical protein
MRKLFSILIVVTFFSIQSMASGMTCDWDLSTTRRIIHGSGCTDSSKRICSGYVTCEKDGAKTTRLATCSAHNCSNNKATTCAMEKNYGSKKPNIAKSNPTKESIQSGGTHN